MDYAKLISKGIQKVPDLMVIYGTEGVGKSTFASKASKALFLDLEAGTKRLEVQRIGMDFATIDQVWPFLNWFYEADHGYETLVIDSLSEFERMAWAKTCLEEGVDNIEAVGGGFSKGYAVALKQWDLLKRAIKTIQAKRQTNVIMIGHAEVKTFTDPVAQAAYDRYTLKLHKHAGAFLREWVDFIGFAKELVTTKGKESAAKQKAYGDATRKLYTERRPSWDAKNRLGLPLIMDFEYAAYSAAAHADPEAKLTAIAENIALLIQDVKDPETAQKMKDFVAKAGKNLTDLVLLQERIRTRVNEQEEKASGTN